MGTLAQLVERLRGFGNFACESRSEIVTNANGEVAGSSPAGSPNRAG